MPVLKLRDDTVSADTWLEDPILALRGVGKELWQKEDALAFVEKLRCDDLDASEPLGTPVNVGLSTLGDEVWQRIQIYQGAVFKTVRGLPVTYEVDGQGIWFFHGNGKRINRKASRADVCEAIKRCPLRTTTEIADLIDPSYLFAILMDKRIRQNNW